MKITNHKKAPNDNPQILKMIPGIGSAFGVEICYLFGAWNL
jgi:hypothetical protein